jgi:addiction module HigA family antidote
VAIPAIHPGEHLADELKELGMSAAELARQLDGPTNRVIEILNGRRAITGDTALRLAHFLGTTAEFWLNLQPVRAARRAEKGWKIHQPPADPKAFRRRACIVRPAPLATKIFLRTIEPRAASD